MFRSHGTAVPIAGVSPGVNWPPRRPGGRFWSELRRRTTSPWIVGRRPLAAGSPSVIPPNMAGPPMCSRGTRTVDGAGRKPEVCIKSRGRGRRGGSHVSHPHPDFTLGRCDRGTRHGTPKGRQLRHSLPPCHGPRRSLAFITQTYPVTPITSLYEPTLSARLVTEALGRNPAGTANQGRQRTLHPYPASSHFAGRGTQQQLEKDLTPVLFAPESS